MLVWFMMALSYPFKEDCLALPLSITKKECLKRQTLHICPKSIHKKDDPKKVNTETTQHQSITNCDTTDNTISAYGSTVTKWTVAIKMLQDTRTMSTKCIHAYTRMYSKCAPWKCAHIHTHKTITQWRAQVFFESKAGQGTLMNTENTGGWLRMLIPMFEHKYWCLMI